MTDRTDQPTRQPSTRHRDDTGTIVLPRPGTPGDPHPKRVSPSALATARTVLADATRRLQRGGLNATARWRLALHLASAQATLRAAGGVA